MLESTFMGIVTLMLTGVILVGLIGYKLKKNKETK